MALSPDAVVARPPSAEPGREHCKEVTKMSATLIPPPPPGTHGGPDDEPPRPPIDYSTAEGFSDGAGDSNWREWMMVGIGLVALLAILAIVFSLASIAQTTGSDSSTAAPAPAKPSSAATAASVSTASAPTLAQAKGIPYERFRPVDATVPAV